MKVILIDGEKQSLELMETTADQLAGVIGFDAVISDDIGDGHGVFFDEDCFIRGTQGRFRIDSLAPIAGRAVVCALGADASADDCGLTVDQLRERVEFL